MRTALIGLLVIIIVVCALAKGASKVGRPASRSRKEPDRPDEIGQLIRDDPVEALRAYGISADVEHLQAQGIDLEGLGYRPPRRD